jgi:S-adenosylmethionine hydrolase
VTQAVEISHSPWRLEPMSATFHGRDVFAPVAARLAAGEALEDAGEPIEVDDLVRLDLPQAIVEDDGAVTAHVLGLDSFGNVLLDVEHGQLAGTALRLGRPLTVRDRGATFARTFADVDPGALLLYEDPSRRLSLAVNGGDAAVELGLAPGDSVRLAP